MRRTTGWARCGVAAVTVAALILGPLATGTAAAQANPTEEARQHFQRGKQLFAAAEYRGAIGEFAAADKLAPSPLLEYNIALCHERLGERSEAVRRYRLYLERVPNAANRGPVEDKIARLESELKAEADAKAAPPALVPVPPTGIPAPPAEIAPGDASKAPPTTGDPELDRAAKLDVGQLRAERRARGPAPPPNRAAALPPETARGERSAPAPAAPREDRKPASESKPIYKEWWFWVAAAVGAIVIVSIATSDSDSSDDRALLLPSGDALRSAPPPGGAVLLRF